jgi:hypothetical protein
LNALPGSGAITGTTNEANSAAPSAAKRPRAGKASFHKSAGLAVTLALAVSLPLLAQHVSVYQDGNSWVEETSGTLPVAHDLRINTDVGSIDVRGKARGVMYVIRKRAAVPTREEAEREFQKMKVSAVKTGDQVVVDGRLLQGDVTRFTADISMQVPYDLKRLFLNTGGGTMKLSSLGAAITGKTRAGAVKLDDLAGPVSVTTGGGDVVGGSLGSEAIIKSGGGNVHIDSITGAAKIGTGGGTVYVGSANTLLIDDAAGSIDVRRCFGNLQASTGGGNVSVGQVAGSVRIDAGAGSVRVAGAGGLVQVTTGGGSVELFKVAKGAKVDTPVGAITVQFTAVPGGFTDSLLHTGSGDVLVFLPDELPVTVHASSDMAPGYGIRSEIPGIRITKQGGGFGPQSGWAEGLLNGGGPLLRVRTGMGHIDFRKTQ